MAPLDAKVVILGAQGVGKTSIVMCYLGNRFSKHVSPTIGASFFTCNVNVLGEDAKLHIWDTAGQERFKAMAPMYYRNADAAFLVFDVTCWDSFTTLKAWVNELNRNVEKVVIMCVIGNKTDLSEDRSVSTEEAQGYANSIGAIYFETSAKANEGVEEAFLNTTMLIMQAVEKQAAPQSTQESVYDTQERSSPTVTLHKEDGSDQRPLFCC